MKLLLLLSGPMAVGKSAIAGVLTESYNFRIVKTGSYLKVLALQRGLGTSRVDLQILGDSFDDNTDYRWIIDEVALPAFRESPTQDFWLMDSVRKKRQVEHFRDAFYASIYHVHLTAPEDVLRKRYEERLATGGEYERNTPYDIAKNNPNEISARSLGEIANLTIDLTTTRPEEAAASILKQWEIRGTHETGGID